MRPNTKLLKQKSYPLSQQLSAPFVLHSQLGCNMWQSALRRRCHMPQAFLIPDIFWWPICAATLFWTLACFEFIWHRN